MIITRIYTILITCFAVVAYILKNLYTPLAICFQVGFILEVWLLVLYIIEYKVQKTTLKS